MSAAPGAAPGERIAPGWPERLRRALRGSPPRWPLGEALHPVAMAAVLVLVVNDWVLKPGAVGRAAPWLTGKLSDVAGLVFAPLVATALVGLVVRRPLSRRRLVAALAVTAAVFVAVKLSSDAAATVAAAWARLAPGARIVADPTDLLALPALAIAAWIGADELRRIARERGGGGPG
ncbi:MAG: hypothetical protein R2939_08165 [Kofleriaceae bacterium]